MGRSDHCAVAQRAPQVPPLPNYPAPTASGEDASCTVSNVAVTQGKGIIRDCRCTAHRGREVQIQGPRHCISHTHSGVQPAKGRPWGLGTHSHTPRYTWGATNTVTAPTVVGAVIQRERHRDHCHRHSPTQSQNRPILRHIHRQCLILSLTYQWWGTSTPLQVRDTRGYRHTPTVGHNHTCGVA